MLGVFSVSLGVLLALALIFVNAPFAVLEEQRLPPPPLPIGDGYCARPFMARSLINVSGMGFGAISQPAVQALSRGAARVGCWMDTGGGGLSPNRHPEIDMIAHSCGLRHAREFRREHGRMVQADGRSMALNMLYPYPLPA